MRETETALAFRDPERSGRVQELIAYLDALTDLPAVQGYKEITFTLLGDLHDAAVLDLGCGAGDDVCTLAGRATGRSRLVGCDLSESLVREAASRAASRGVTAEFVVADACALPFPDGAFTACRADRVLQHLSRPTAAVDELVRVTRSGGVVVTSDPDWTTLTIEPDSDPVRRLADALVSRARNPCVSDEVRQTLLAHGAHVDVVPVAARFTGLALADAVIELRTGLDGAIAQERIGAEEGARLWDELVAADRDGRFEVRLAGRVVAGRLP